MRLKFGDGTMENIDDPERIAQIFFLAQRQNQELPEIEFADETPEDERNGVMRQIQFHVDRLRVKHSLFGYA